MKKIVFSLNIIIIVTLFLCSCADSKYVVKKDLNVDNLFLESKKCPYIENMPHELTMKGEVPAGVTIEYSYYDSNNIELTSSYPINIGKYNVYADLKYDGELLKTLVATLEISEFEIKTINLFKYCIIDDEAIIIGYEDTLANEITLPNKIDDYPVTRIGSYAFQKMTYLTDVTLSDDIKEIEAYAFYQSGINNVTLSCDLELIGSFAFMDCMALERFETTDCINFDFINNALYSKDHKIFFQYATANENLEYSMLDGTEYIHEYALANAVFYDIFLPDSLLKIGNGAFYNCIYMDTINIPYNVLTIGDNAFYGCGFLTEVNLPDNLNIIGSAAFYQSNIHSITIPNTVYYIGEKAFYYCPMLKEINASGYYVSYDGVLYEDDYKILLTYPMGKDDLSYDIKENTEIIREYAFFNSKLECINLNDNLIKIEKYAFAYSNIGSIDCPNSLIEIDEFAFNNSNIQSAILPNELEEIQKGLFYGCKNLISVTIPKSVTRINDYALYGCESVLELTIPENVSYIGIGAFCGTKINEITIPSGVSEISDGLFLGTDLKKIDILGDITYIGSYSFANTRITEISITSKTVVIGDYAFYNCNQLSNILFNDISSIGEYSFAYCSSLKKFDTKNLEEIEKYAFMYCTNLESFTTNAKKIDSYAFYCSSSLNDVKLNCVEEISSYAFSKCTNLSRIIIPSTILKIEANTFFDSSVTIYIDTIDFETSWNTNDLLVYQKDKWEIKDGEIILIEE